MKGKQKFSVTCNSNKLGSIDFTEFSKVTSEALHIALHIVIFESFIKSTVSYLPKLKVTPSFCFAFKIPDDPTATKEYAIRFPLSSI